MEYQNLNDYEVLYLICESDEQAYSCMYTKYKPLINKMAKLFLKKYKITGIEYDDLYQQGMIGLTEAIHNYSYNVNASFFTFAFLCIKREMNKLIANAIRNKNNLLNFSISMELELTEDKETLNDVIYDKRDLTENRCFSKMNEEYMFSLKYKLKEEQMPIYELKINGFSNKEISSLLDIPYKKVDNCLLSIKSRLKNQKNNIIE